MKIGIEHTNGGRWLIAVIKQRLCNLHGLLAHVAFNVTAFFVDAVELFGQGIGMGRVVCAQALNAQRHVGQAAGGVDARA